jgi:predicted metal-dependent hydrolase
MEDCDNPLPPHAKEGLRLFNEGEYFEAHEELETAWKEETGAIRRLYQGILQAAVMYLHIQRGNYEGAVKVYGRSMRWLRNWPEVCCGVNVAKLRADMQRVIAEMERLGPERIAEFDSSMFQPVAWGDE